MSYSLRDLLTIVTVAAVYCWTITVAPPIVILGATCAAPATIRTMLVWRDRQRNGLDTSGWMLIDIMAWSMVLTFFLVFIAFPLLLLTAVATWAMVIHLPSALALLGTLVGVTTCGVIVAGCLRCFRADWHRRFLRRS